jgi:TonB-dependent SusC/RagA subfamily outer membrane receptor
MQGVSVMVKGTLRGTLTESDGSFALNVPDNATVILSFMGFKPVEIPVENQTQLDITLEPDVKVLNDVVITAVSIPVERVTTALGIERDKKTLTYSLQQISGAELNKAGDPNFMNALNGKVAGVNVQKSAVGIGGSTIATIRGIKSFSGSSAPLYVIDGTPMVNEPGFSQGYDTGDRLSQLNPEDIESVTVLKGANAAILYGSQGANGVVLITTKKGR